jgi:transposase
MKRGREAFVGIDTAKVRNAVTVAEGGRQGEMRYLGELDANLDAVAKLVRKLADRYETLHFCYEAGPTGYGLYRQNCVDGPRVHRRGALDDPTEAGRTGEGEPAGFADIGPPAPGWRTHRRLVPDETHEAVRDLVRTRATAVEDYRRKRQHVTAFLLRHGRIFEGQTTWKGRHLRWLDTQNFIHPAQRLAYQEMLNAMRAGAERIDRLDTMLLEIIPQWTMAPVVDAFQAVRGIGFTNAATLVAEAGDIRRFDHPRQLMAFLGLVPSERSTGETRRQGGITNYRLRVSSQVGSTARVLKSWRFVEIALADAGSPFFGGQNGEKSAILGHSDRTEPGAVPTICLTPPDRWTPGPGAEAVPPHPLQLHPESSVPGVPMERIADCKRR